VRIVDLKAERVYGNAKLFGLQKASSGLLLIEREHFSLNLSLPFSSFSRNHNAELILFSLVTFTPVLLY